MVQLVRAQDASAERAANAATEYAVYQAQVAAQLEHRKLRQQEEQRAERQLLMEAGKQQRTQECRPDVLSPHGTQIANDGRMTSSVPRPPPSRQRSESKSKQTWLVTGSCAARHAKRQRQGGGRSRRKSERNCCTKQQCVWMGVAVCFVSKQHLTVLCGVCLLQVDADVSAFDEEQRRAQREQVDAANRLQARSEALERAVRKKEQLEMDAQVCVCVCRVVDG